jgi:hypothetical protein
MAGEFPSTAAGGFLQHSRRDTSTGAASACRFYER